MWSFGAVLFELLMRSRLWHSDADGNLSNPDDYRKLAEWSADAAREAVSRVPDRWGQALLVRLLAPSAEARPRSMASVLQHPFFKQRDQFVAPPLAEGEGHHLFLCHAPGNAVRWAPAPPSFPRPLPSPFKPALPSQSNRTACNERLNSLKPPLRPPPPPPPRQCATAIKGAVQEAVPGASVWLDQDHRDANEAGAFKLLARRAFPWDSLEPWSPLFLRLASASGEHGCTLSARACTSQHCRRQRQPPRLATRHFHPR